MSALAGRGFVRGVMLVWWWRWELGVALLVWMVGLWLLLPVALVWGWPRLIGGALPSWLARVDSAVRLVRDPFVKRALKRRLRRALIREDLAPVRVRHVHRAADGWKLDVTFLPGLAGWSNDRHSTRLASTMRARKVTCTHHADDPRKGTVRIVTRDPLADLFGDPPGVPGHFHDAGLFHRMRAATGAPGRCPDGGLRGIGRGLRARRRGCAVRDRGEHRLLLGPDRLPGASTGLRHFARSAVHPEVARAGVGHSVACPSRSSTP